MVRIIENEEMLMTVTLEAMTVTMVTLEAMMVTMLTLEAREMTKTGDATSCKGFNTSH